MTRNGKIARPPLAIRPQLNQRPGTAPESLLSALTRTQLS